MAEEVKSDDVESSRIISVLAESKRRDRWTVAPRTSMFTVLARSFFDFRKAEATGDTVEINVVCVFGKVTLIVPEGTDVELSGMSFLASATCEVAASDTEPSHLPKLVVVGHTVFGKLSVRTPIPEDDPVPLVIESVTESVDESVTAEPFETVGEALVQEPVPEVDAADVAAVAAPTAAAAAAAAAADDGVVEPTPVVERTPEAVGSSA